MFTKRRMSIIALLLSAMMCLALVACTSTPASTANPAQTAQATDTTAADTLPAGYPDRVIEIVSPFDPGNLAETYVRVLMDSIGKTHPELKNKFSVAFHTGGSGAIGWSYIAQAKPDGYTIGVVVLSSDVLPVSRAPQPWGYDKYSFICNMMTDPGVIVVAPDSKYKSLKEIIEACKANPESVSISVPGLTNQCGLSIRQIEYNTGCKFNIIPDSTGEASQIAAVRGHHVDCSALNVGDVMNDIRAGTLVALATGDSQRSAWLPDVPTYTEEGAGVVAANMRSICGPKDLPEPIRKYLEGLFIEAMNDPAVVEKAKMLNVPSVILDGQKTYDAFKAYDAVLKAQWAAHPWE